MLLPEVAGRVVGRLAFVVRLHRNNTPLLRLKLSKLPPPVGKKKHRRASRHRVAPPLPSPSLPFWLLCSSDFTGLTTLHAPPTSLPGR